MEFQEKEGSSEVVNLQLTAETDSAKNVLNRMNKKKRKKAKIASINNTISVADIEECCINFDNSFKYYKRRCPPPDFSQILNLNLSQHWQQCGVRFNFYLYVLFITFCFSIALQVKSIPLYPFDEEEATQLGLKPLSFWRLLTFCKKPGLLYIPNPFTQEGQQLWVSHSLRDYTQKPPHRLNLDAHPEWAVGDGKPQWWEECCRDDERGKILRRKLRWSTLGYHHNWDTKVYSEQDHSKFPPELACLSRLVARAAGFSDFSAEAAIINFYHLDSTLAGHTDHSEQNLTAPLLSFSFGQSAIFLLGGPNKSERPLALLVQSGDIVIMSGECRLSYHGVPRIISTVNCEPWSSRLASDSWIPCEDFLRQSRINLNVRQVLNNGNKSLLC